jgi:hypothetical protein
MGETLMPGLQPEKGKRLVLNLLCLAAGGLIYFGITAILGSLESAMIGGQTSNDFLIYGAPLIRETLGAVAAGVLLGILVKSDRPMVYGLALGALLGLYEWSRYTVINFQSATAMDLASIALSVILPVAIAAAAVFWVGRRGAPGQMAGASLSSPKP